MRMDRQLERPGKWFPAAPSEERSVQPLRGLIMVMAPRVMIVSPQSLTVRDVELEQLRVRAEKAEAEAQQLRQRWMRHLAAEAVTGHAGAPLVEDTSEARIPLLSAAMSGRWGVEPKPRKASWLRRLLNRWRAAL